MNDSVVPMLDSERVKASLTAAMAPQRQQKPGLVTFEEMTLPQVYRHASCTDADMRRWLKVIRTVLDYAHINVFVSTVAPTLHFFD